jgi:hypothetical protein
MHVKCKDATGYLGHPPEVHHPGLHERNNSSTYPGSPPAQKHPDLKVRLAL